MIASDDNLRVDFVFVASCCQVLKSEGATLLLADLYLHSIADDGEKRGCSEDRYAIQVDSLINHSGADC